MKDLESLKSLGSRGSLECLESLESLESLDRLGSLETLASKSWYVSDRDSGKTLWPINLAKVGIRYIDRRVCFREQRSGRNQPPPSNDRGFVNWNCKALAEYSGVTGTLLGSA